MSQFVTRKLQDAMNGTPQGASELNGVVRWIPCSERMPPPIDRNKEEGETYAVIKTNRYGVQFKDAAQWQPDTGFERWWLPDPRPDYTITHWMPLPEYPPNAVLSRAPKK